MSEPDLRDPHLDDAYRQVPGDEPPPALDERIRAAARRAVGAGPESLAARRQRSWAARWRVPLSVAATVVIAVTLTLMVREEEQRALQEIPARAPVPVVPGAGENRAPPPAADEGKRTDARPSPAAEPAAPAGATAPGAGAPQTPAAGAAAPPAPKLEKRELRQQRLEEAKPAAASPPPAPAPAPAAGRAEPQPSAVPQAAPRRDASPSLSRERALGDRPARETRSAPAPSRSPEEWIEEIRRLKAQGRDADAAAELAEFRRHHPEYPLPADLAR
jgi:hypothetical protein